jgi:hypothetical protein
MLAAAAVIQTLNKIAAYVSTTAADVSPGGMLDLLRTGTLTQNRGLYYGGTTAQALVYMAAYMGRLLSVDFNGSNTTTDMHMKQLAIVQPDPSMNQTLLNSCKTAGVDIYGSILGSPGILCSGANWFVDRVYNLQWLVGALQVAMFNYLAQSATKTPQTEDAMTGFKGAQRAVLRQAVTNGYLAGGTWTLPNYFGNQALFIQNIQQFGFYIYSQPISQQAATARQARQAPLCQIAIKEAGSINSASAQINVNP